MDDPIGSAAITNAVGSSAEPVVAPESEPLPPSWSWIKAVGRSLGWFPLVNLVLATVALVLSLGWLIDGHPGAVGGGTTVERLVTRFAPRAVVRGDSALVRLAGVAARSNAWLDGKRRYLQSIVFEETPDDWHLPPAAAATSPPFPGRAVMIALESNTPIQDGRTLEVLDPIHDESARFRDLPAKLGPQWHPEKLRMRLIWPGLLSTTYGSWVDVELSGDGGARSLSVPPASKGDQRLDLAVAWEPSAFDAPLHAGFPPQQLIAASHPAQESHDWHLPGVARSEAPPQSTNVVTLERLQTGVTTRLIEVNGDRPYLAVYVWSESGRMPAVRARRNDTGEFIGITNEDPPAFVAVTDRSAAVWLEMVEQGSESTDLRLLALTDGHDATTPLFVEALGRSFGTLRVNGVAANHDARVQVGRWLRDALGVTWGGSEIEQLRARDAELASVLDELSADDPSRSIAHGSVAP